MADVENTRAHHVGTDALTDGPWLFDGHVPCTREEIAHAVVEKLAEGGLLTDEALARCPCGSAHD